MSLPVFDKSVLLGVNPRGRVDVLASNVLAKVAERKGLAPQFAAVRPVLDFGLLYCFGPKHEFARAMRSLSRPLRAKRPRRIAAGGHTAGKRVSARARRPRREVFDAEVVVL